MKIVRKHLSADELNPRGRRYVLSEDMVQTLIGDTWTDTPTADPRIDPSGLFPPRTGGSAACDAAANVVAHIKFINDTAIASATQAAIVSSTLGLLLLLIPAIGWVAEALWAFADLLLTIGTAVVDAAFTSTVYDDLTCYFFCAADASGQWSADAIADVLAQINDNHPGTVYNVLSNLFYQMGIVGLNNAGATGEEVGDCSACTACDETCHEYNPPVEDESYFNSNDGITLFCDYDSGEFVAGKTLVLNTVTVDWTALDGTGIIVVQGVDVTVYSEDVYPVGNTFTDDDTSGTVHAVLDTTGSGHVYRIQIHIHTQWSGGGAYSIPTLFKFEYDAVHTPFGWSFGENCTP